MVELLRYACTYFNINAAPTIFTIMMSLVNNFLGIEEQL